MQVDLKEKKYFFLKMLLIMLFSSAYISVPWEQIRGYEFGDLLVYKEYFLYGTSVIDEVEFNGLVDYATGEYLWHYLIGELISSGVSHDLVFSGISFFCILVFSYFVVFRCGVAWLFLLINPLVVDLVFSQLRLALALTLLGLAWLISKRITSALLIVASVFVHTAVVLFLFIFLFSKLTGSKYFGHSSQRSFVFWLLFTQGVFLSIAIGPLRSVILGAIGDRRAEYSDMSVSFSYTLFWVFFLFCIWLQRIKLVSDVGSRFSIVILSLVFSNLFTQGYTLRFLSASYPLLLGTMSSLKGWVKVACLISFFGYFLLQWVYWFNI